MDSWFMLNRCAMKERMMIPNADSTVQNQALPDCVVLEADHDDWCRAGLQTYGDKRLHCCCECGMLKCVSSSVHQKNENSKYSHRETTSRNHAETE
jgi:hypothetical protein